MNRWGISGRNEAEIRKRDKRCVYCDVKMKAHPKARGVPRDKATWEHIDNNDLNPKHLFNIVICCGECNTSKGAKELLEWFESEYCKKKEHKPKNGFARGQELAEASQVPISSNPPGTNGAFSNTLISDGTHSRRA